MLQNLDNLLKNLLDAELPRELSLKPEITFVTPEGNTLPKVSLPAIDLFLYDVRENRELRSGEWRNELQSDGSFLRERPPVRVACSYIITAWADDPATEHLLLGETMRVLLRYPRLPVAAFAADAERARELTGALSGPDLPAAVAQPGSIQNLGEFWRAIGGKPHAALLYTVTIAVATGAAPEALQAVKEHVVRTHVGLEGKHA
jgi:hypothetical protein